MSIQRILAATETYEELDDYFAENQIRRVFLVCGSSIKLFRINTYIKKLKERRGIEVIRFSDFQSNPAYESVVQGVKVFKERHCDSIIAIGGGSAMDVAKCIKLYSNMDSSVNYLRQKIVPNDIKLLAVPTTAGTGSEATRYAVIYYEGIKQSVTDDSCIPQTVLIDSSTLQTLPDYQRKSTMMDAFSHALESFWSVNSTEESREYSQKAIKMILENWDSYLSNEEKGNAGMLWAANTAGMAINIAQTTAGHSFSYKLTGLYGIAHGHAAAICNAVLFPYLVQNIEKCIDARGKGYLSEVMIQMANAMGCATPEEAADKFNKMLNNLGLETPCSQAGDYAVLRRSVNLERLKNYPIALSENVIDELYHKILKQNEG